MVAVAPKGTALGLCDLISAMFSGYFIESGGAVTPAIDAFLRQEVKDEKEREARTRRGAKAKVPQNLRTRFMLPVGPLMACHKLENIFCLVVAGHITCIIRSLCNGCLYFRSSLGRY